MNTASTHTSDLRFARKKVNDDMTKNKHRRLSALFRDIRKMNSVMGIGDWPIMSMIVQTVFRYRDLSDHEVYNLCNQSKEYKELGRGDKIKFKDKLYESINV